MAEHTCFVNGGKFCLGCTELKPVTVVDTIPIDSFIKKENDLKPVASRLLDELMEEACCCAITGQDCQGENCKNPCKVCDA